MTSFGSSKVWMCRSTLIHLSLSILLVLILVLDFHQQESNRGSACAKATARQVTRIPRIRVVQGLAEKRKLATACGLRNISRASHAQSLGWWNGRHVRLRGVCRKACGFKSRPEHQIV